MVLQKVKSKDLFAYQSPSELACSPSGAYLAFLLTQMDERTDSYQSDLWLMKPEAGKESLRQLTASGDIKSFRWEDEEHILFSSAREKAEAGSTNIYRIDIHLGEAEKAYTVPAAGAVPARLADGTFLLQKRVATDPEKEIPDRAVEGKDFWTFTDSPFLRDGEPYSQRKRTGLYLWKPEEDKPEPVTPKYFEVKGFSVREDGKRILYFGEAYEDRASLFQCLREYDVENGKTRELIAPGTYQISMADYCQDGIFLQMSDLSRFVTQNHDLYHLDTETGQLCKIASPDGMFTSLIDIDVTYGKRKNRKLLGNRMIGARLAGTRTRFDEVDITSGEIRRIADTDAYTCLDCCGNNLYAVAMEQYELPEIYRIAVDTGEKTKLTDFGGAYLASHEVSKPEKLSFLSENGEQVEGFVIKPAGFDPEKSYPGVLMIHGGPKWSYSASFTHLMQCMAAEGMFVFFCNPHGGDGYGESFLNMVRSWGKEDYLHCMEFTDQVLKKYPQLDEKRLGVTGGSYGGYMTNWIIGHTDRFAAAVSQRGISNLVTEGLLSDIGERLMRESGGQEDFWSNEALFWEMSPLKYVKNVHTPTLVIHSDHDFRCYPGEAAQFFTALKQNGVPSELLLFHGDSHGLSRSGKPSHRIVRVEAITGWFKRYL